MKNRDNEEKFIFFKLRSFLNIDKKRKRAETVEAAAAVAVTTALTFSFRSSSRHNKERHEKKNSRSFFRHENEHPKSFFRHEKEYTSISPLVTYPKITKSIFSSSQFYQQQPSVEIETAFAFAIDAFATTDSASFLSNSNMPSQFQQSVTYNPFSLQSIGSAASSQQ